jgi:AraC-like DNA-binding protein
MNQTSIQFQFQTDRPDIRLVNGMNVNHNFPFHIHESFSLGIVEKGQRVIKLKSGEEIVISAQECFVLNPNQPHCCMTGKGENHDYWVISIAPTLIYDVYKKITGQGEGCVAYFPNVRITAPAIYRGFSAWIKKQAFNKTVIDDKFIKLLKALVASHAVSSERCNPIQHSIVKDACDYIGTNLNRVIKLNEIAARTHMSPFYLNRIFREEIGVPPYTYLLQTRIKKSIDLLMKTDSITEAAFCLGFSDQSHFTRLFKKDVGITPKQFLNINSIHRPFSR